MILEDIAQGIHLHAGCGLVHIDKHAPGAAIFGIVVGARHADVEAR